MIPTILVEPAVTPPVYWNTPYVRDNSGIVSLITSSVNSGNVFQIGATNVTYYVEDGYGNTNECSFTVVVQGKKQSQQ